MGAPEGNSDSKLYDVLNYNSEESEFLEFGNQDVGNLDSSGDDSQTGLVSSSTQHI